MGGMQGIGLGSAFASVGSMAPPAACGSTAYPMSDGPRVSAPMGAAGSLAPNSRPPAASASAAMGPPSHPGQASDSAIAFDDLGVGSLLAGSKKLS